MFKITDKVKERFCKDCKIPIKVFSEPYFTQRIQVLDPIYGSIEKWKGFLENIKQYDSDQDFFEDYNRIKQCVIDYIKENESFNRFNNCDMNRYATINRTYPIANGCTADIYKPTNIGKQFISLDIKKANFTALKYFGGIFDQFEEYEDFIKQYTDNPHFINSKYIREVVFGNCNPRRQVTFERYLVDMFICFLYENEKLFKSDTISLSECICYISNDEIVIDCGKTPIDYTKIQDLASDFKNATGIEFKSEQFTLKNICKSIPGYIKVFPDNSSKLKCCDVFMIPIIIKHLYNQNLTEDDLVFVSDGKLARYMEFPKFDSE